MLDSIDTLEGKTETRAGPTPHPAHATPLHCQENLSCFTRASIDRSHATRPRKTPTPRGHITYRGDVTCVLRFFLPLCNLLYLAPTYAVVGRERERKRKREMYAAQRQTDLAPPTLSARHKNTPNHRWTGGDGGGREAPGPPLVHSFWIDRSCARQAGAQKIQKYLPLTSFALWRAEPELSSPAWSHHLLPSLNQDQDRAGGLGRPLPSLPPASHPQETLVPTPTVSYTNSRVLRFPSVESHKSTQVHGWPDPPVHGHCS